MEGLTIEQTRLLKTWAEDLWILLDQDDFNNIAKIFKNAVDRQIEYEYQEVKTKKRKWLDIDTEVMPYCENLCDTNPFNDERFGG